MRPAQVVAIIGGPKTPDESGQRIGVVGTPSPFHKLFDPVADEGPDPARRLRRQSGLGQGLVGCVGDVLERVSQGAVEVKDDPRRSVNR